jgi:hypothetical protein
VRVGANAERARRRGRVGEAARVDVDERDVGAAPRERERDRPADPARRAGDDGDAAAQPHRGHGGAAAVPKPSTPSSIRLQRIARTSAR